MKNIFKILIIVSSLITVIFCNQKIEYYETGEIKEVTSYNEVRNKLELFQVKKYYKNGRLKNETNYKNGKLNGKIFTYCENGNLLKSGSYKDDLMNSEWKYYRCDGTLMGRGRFINGEDKNHDDISGIPHDGRVGVWMFYYEDGKKIFLYQTHKNGQLDGLVKCFSRKGDIISNGFYKNNKKWDGSFTNHDSYGEIIDIENYIKGKYINTKNKDGEIFSLETFLNGTWKRIESTYYGETFYESKDFTVYSIYNDSSSNFYSFTYNDQNEYVLTHQLITYIDYLPKSIQRNSGEIILGFEGWEDIVEGSKIENHPVVRLSKDKFKIIFPSSDYDNEEIYIRLDEDNIPDYLKDILN